MSNQLRKIKRERSKKLASVDEALFGPELAPTEALRQRRQTLMNEFRAIMADWNETNPVKLVGYLMEAHESYRPETDGVSRVMTLIGECIEHCRLEKNARNSSMAPTTGNA